MDIEESKVCSKRSGVMRKQRHTIKRAIELFITGIMIAECPDHIVYAQESTTYDGYSEEIITLR